MLDKKINDLNEYITDLHKENEALRKKYLDAVEEIKSLQEENKIQDHELERLRNIIKEVREYTKKHFIADDGAICKELEERFCEINYSFIDELLEILDKESK